MSAISGSRIFNPSSSGSGGLTPGQEAVAWRGQWGYRIKRAAASLIDLETVGPNSVVGGTVVPAGITTQWDLSALNEMDSTGGDSGTPISVGLFLYVYWCEDGPFAPGLGFTRSAPVMINGQLLLSNATDPTQFLFLGWIQTDAATVTIQDNVQRRHIVNWWHRRPTPIAVVPNYTNNNAQTPYSRTAAAWAPMTATAATSEITWIGNGEDAVYLDADWTILQDLAVQAFGGIGRTTATPLQTAVMPSSIGLAQSFVSCHCSYSFLPAGAGLETAYLLCMTNNVAVIFIADHARTGAGSDPPATALRGVIMA